MQEVGKQLEKLIENANKFGEIRIIATEIQAEDIDQMRNIAENLRNNLSKNGIALLSTILNEKVQLVCTVTDDLTVKYPASKLVLAAAKQLGGGGGGKPHLATAGGKEISKLPDLLKNFADLVKEM
jgi:alanyl-tRNA synthetase